MGSQCVRQSDTAFFNHSVNYNNAVVSLCKCLMRLMLFRLSLPLRSMKCCSQSEAFGSCMQLDAQ